MIGKRRVARNTGRRRKRVERTGGEGRRRRTRASRRTGWGSTRSETRRRAVVQSLFQSGINEFILVFGLDHPMTLLA